MRALVVIPARGGSKGIPYKNIKLLNGKPLIYYTIQAAREVFPDEDICVSTDDLRIKECVEKIGLTVPFLRPAELSTDMAGTNEVLVHALEWYRLNEERRYDVVVLLQATSPFRTGDDIKGAMELFDGTPDMVVSVTEENEASNLYWENRDGLLEKAFPKVDITRRQDSPRMYKYNGAIYIVKAEQILKNGLHNANRKRKYVMEKSRSVDIDTIDDWKYAEWLMKR